MKTKYSVFPFIPFAIAVIGLRIMGLLGRDGNGEFLGMNSLEVTYAMIGLTLALFLVCVIINLFDRKTAPVYPVEKNPVAGVLAVLSGVSVMAFSVVSFLTASPELDRVSYYMMLICAAFSIPAGIALILMARVHFSGKSVVSSISMLFIFPALWGCSELVLEFLKATKVSISASDMAPLFCYIFITLYLFSHAMIVSRIRGRNPVKACYIYGLPAVAISLGYGVYSILVVTKEGLDLSTLVGGVQFVLIAAYALSFIIEMFMHTYTKDEIEILDGMPDDDDSYENSYVKSGGYDELVFSEKKTQPEGEAQSVNSFDDFVLGYGNYEDDEPIPYLTEHEMKKAVDNSKLVFYNENETVQESAPKANAVELEKDDVPEIKSEPAEVVEEKPADVSYEKPEAEKSEIEAFSSPLPEKPLTEKSEDISKTEKRMSEIDKLIAELESKK